MEAFTVLLGGCHPGTTVSKIDGFRKLNLIAEHWQ